MNEQDIQQLLQKLSQASDEIGKVIVGQRQRATPAITLNAEGSTVLLQGVL